MIAIKEHFKFIFSKKRHYVFLLFIICTSVFWFVSQLSKEYHQVIQYKIKYVDVPPKYVFQETPIQTLSVRLHTLGFYFFKKAFSSNVLEISLKNIQQKDKYQYYLSNSNLLKQVRLHVSDRVEVVEVLEEDLFLKLGNKSFKKVPVVPNVKIQYHLGYNSFEGKKIIPDSIEISGPELQLQKINRLALEPFEQLDVMLPISQRLAIVKPSINNVTYSTETVQLHVAVDKVTEKTITLPVQIVNATQEGIVIYPKKVKVSCQVKLSEFNQIKENDFMMIADFGTKGDKYIDIQLVKKPVSVSSITLQTDKVEYLILK